MEGIGIIFILVALALYFLPSFVGSGKRNATAIFLLNLFLGWTLVGWVAALVWASTSDDPPSPLIHNSRTDEERIDRVKRLKELLDSGAITENEYQREKTKMLR